MKTRQVEWIAEQAGLLFLFSSLAVVFFVFPVWHTFSEVLLGTGTYRHDAVLNAGILEWGFRSIWSPQLRFFDWPPGFPLRGTLAATENLAGWQVLYSPLRAAGATVAASYNVVLLMSLVISGAGCAAFARRLGALPIAAVIGGIVFAFNPFHIEHMVHLQTMAVCWSPFALIGLDMTLENGSRSGLLLLSIATILTVLSGMYFGVFLVIIIPGYTILCWLTGRHKFSYQAAVSIAIAMVISLVLLLPLLVPYFRYARTYGAYPHPGDEVSLSALSLRSLLQTPVWLDSWNWSRLSVSDTGGFASAFPGVATLLLCGAGLVMRPGDEAVKQRVTVLVLLGTACLLLAFGPTLLLRRGEPLGLTRAMPLPGHIFLYVSAIRWPMRIYLYSVLCLAILASLGATRLLLLAEGSRRNVIAIGFCFALLLELRPSAWFVEQSTKLLNPTQMSDAYSFLKSEADRGGVVELPIKLDSGLVTPFATRYAYASSGHLRGVVAFHGSMFPPLLDSLRLAAYDLPKPAAMDMMRKHGVTRLVIHRELMSADSSRSLTSAIQSQGFHVLFSSRESTIFSLVRRAE